MQPIPHLYGEGGAQNARRVGWEESGMSDNDWKRTLPFRRHWATYLIFKLLVLALAAIVAWNILHAFEVV